MSSPPCWNRVTAWRWSTRRPRRDPRSALVAEKICRWSSRKERGGQLGGVSHEHEEILPGGRLRPARGKRSLLSRAVIGTGLLFTCGRDASRADPNHGESSAVWPIPALAIRFISHDLFDHCPDIQ